MSLNDTDVHKQIQRLVAFIDQEANTKVEEIDAKAEEEFQIEKSRLVQNQRLKIMEFYTKKEKQLELAKKIQDSNLMHQARLKVLHNRERFIEELLQEARKRLYAITKDTKKYSVTLGGLITQGLLQLVEPEATIKCRSEDYDLVKSLIPASVKEVKRQAGIDCNVTVDNVNFLPQDSCGGVEIYVRQGRICVNNTLDARLDQVAEKMMPQIREQLFGVNKNRKFHT
ncbi:unnamed protein product [Taenia asiatica]|uniref:V-type proton ATPase subunit E n=1 Tax=Taenia asiatica TaxID=60517 RepID=A0A0R3W367_TAEAS|nr:unnamed protein product [Taenia asiatica]